MVCNGDMTTRQILAVLILTGSLLAAVLVVLLPTLPVWGERHLPHEGEVTLPLPVGQKVEQTVVWERDEVDVVVLWVDGDRALPVSGVLQLEVVSGSISESTIYRASDIPPSGLVPFVFDERIKVGSGNRGSLIVSLIDADERVYLKYQIDASIYSDGELIYHPNLRKVGDLAWQARYRRPALGSSLVTGGYGLGLLVSGVIVGGMLWRWPKRGAIAKHLSTTGFLPRGINQYWVALIIFLLISIFYLTSLTDITFGSIELADSVKNVSPSIKAKKGGGLFMSPQICGNMYPAAINSLAWC